MSIYRYADNSAVREMTVHTAADRPPVALLAAAPGAPRERLASLRAGIEAAGWQSLPVYADAQPLLQVSGFNEAADLDNLLRTKGFAQGQAAIIAQPGDDVKAGYGDKVRGNSLKLAGAFNLMGTIGGFLAGGIRQKDPYLKTAGSLYLLSEGNLVRYANAGPEHYLREVSEDLAEFIRHEDGRLPEGGSLAAVAQQQKSGPLAAAERFLYRHPAQVSLSLSSAAASSVLMSGLKQAQRKEGFGKLGFGIGSVGLKIISLLVPEKSKEEIEQAKAGPQNIAQKAVTWIQEKPLRFYGLGSLMTDVLLPLDAWQEFRRAPGKKGWIYTAVAGTGYTIADIMTSMSSKERSNEEGGKFTEDEQRRLVAMAAESLALRPEPARAPMARKLADFLVKRKEMRGDAQSISRGILEQAERRRDNPWAERVAMNDIQPAIR